MTLPEMSPGIDPAQGWEVADEYAPLPPEDEELAHGLHQRLIREVNLEAAERQGTEGARQAVEAAVRRLVSDSATGLYGERRELIIRRVVDDAVGLGPLEPLIRDFTVSEIMVDAPDEIYFERDGIIYLSSLRFRDAAHIMLTVDRMISPVGRRVDESSPYVDARLLDGSRVNAVISGGTGTGKTPLLNALSAYIPERERIITIEDPIELKLQQRHVIACEARPPSIEGKLEVTQRDLLRNALRMRPDRVIIGEVRGPEAFDMMQARSEEHEG